MSEENEIPKECMGCINFKAGNDKEGPGCSEDQDPKNCKLYLPIEVIKKVEEVWAGKPSLP